MSEPPHGTRYLPGPMRRLLAPLLLAATLALAGCGGDGESSLDDALGYLPGDAALAVAISTDVDGDDYAGVRELVERFPFGQQAVDALRRSIEDDGVDYERDVEPILGNELVFGVPDARALQQDEVRDFLLALKVEDVDKARELIQRGTREAGEHDGTTVYASEEGDAFSAIHDEVFVIARSRERLQQAIDQRQADDRLREDDLEEALEGLPDDAVAKLYTDVEALLEADPQTANARRVEWISALRTLGMTAQVTGDRVALDFVLDTEEGELSDQDLPVAPGEESPGVVTEPGEIGVGVRSPAQLVRFAERVAQAVNPQGFGDYAAGKRQFGERLDVNVDRDVIAQFEGDVSVALSPGGEFGVRAELADPRRFETTLRRLARVIPSIAEGAGFDNVGVAEPRGDEDYYAVAEPGGDGIVYGVVDGVFVLATTPERASALAAADPRAVEGAQGAIVATADAERVADEVLRRVEGGQAGALRLFTGPLGQLLGFARSDADGLRGRVVLGID